MAREISPGSPVEDLATPAVLIDVAVLDRNIAAMGAAARAAGVRLRPHAKTHKLPEVGRRQLAAGASGLTLAKTSEAEVFADAGFDDLFLAYPVVGLGKPERLLALAGRVRIAVGVDSLDGARALAAPFAAAGRAVDVLLKIDTGSRRVGVRPEDAPALAVALAEVPGLAFRGLFTHAGHTYGAETAEAVRVAGEGEGAALARTAAQIRARGVDVAEVSVGSTPSARHAMRVEGVTECRPGNYVYHDATQVSLGTCGLEDCAMTVVATVVSVPERGRAVVDAGSKTLSTDPLRPHPGGHGFVLGRKSRLSRLSEEHGVIDVVEGESFRVGERVRILPNHACVVSNLHDEVIAVKDGRVAEVWRVAARGMVQ
jgi:D-serine deaminase-like pyridoxal phosphate-dependent protein